MQLVISDKINVKKDGFYITVEYMHGDADLYTHVEYGPLPENLMILVINFIRRMEGTRDIWDARKSLKTEFNIWSNEDTDYDGTDFDSLSDLSEDELALYKDTNNFEMIKDVEFKWEFDSTNFDAVASIEDYYVTYVKNNMEHNVKICD